VGYTGEEQYAALNDSIRQATEALAAAMALSAARQETAHQFIVANGHAVVAGHGPVTGGQDARGRDARPA
jgi:hypothetical protein